jgi:3-oxoacyl-[acyl-carrier protein] reductase
MSDLLLEWSKNPQFRKAVSTLGLPIPMPQALRRSPGPTAERPLQDQVIALSTPARSALLAPLSAAMAGAGADLLVAGDDAVVARVSQAGEPFSRPARHFDPGSVEEGARFDALVFDATGLARPSELVALHAFFHPLVPTLARCGRVVVVGRPPEAQPNAEAAATQAALDGFVRSLAKELGKRGATAQLLVVERGAEGRVAGPLRFVLSPKSAYVSGQPVRVCARARAPKVAGPWTFPLEGKVALVTGAARGIGAATARLLAADGARVVCLDRPNDAAMAATLAREIGGDVLTVDITDADAARIIAGHVGSKHGGLDIVVHNAGITRDKTLARMKPELWTQTLDVNLAAIIETTAAWLPELIRDEGRIVALSSIGGIAGNMGQTNYAASKAGVIGYVRSLAPEVASRGITVNAVAPGFIETRLTDAMPVAIREVARRMNNLGQGGLPMDIGAAIQFLASPGASGITGQVLRVCGGALVGA